MTQMSHVYLACECTRNNIELLERESCHMRGVVLPLGAFGAAPCSKTSSYATALLSSLAVFDGEWLTGGRNGANVFDRSWGGIARPQTINRRPNTLPAQHTYV